MISYSNNFNDIKNIVDSLSSDDLHRICNGQFKNSPYVIYRDVLLYDNEPAAFIDVYKLPDMKEDGVIVMACKEKYRRKGYTNNLVKRMRTTLKDKNLIWKTQSDNGRSINLARKNGFNPVYNERTITNMTDLEYIICEAESNDEIDLYTRDKMLSILYESKSNNINTVIFDLGSVLVKSTIKENVKKTKIPEEYIESMAYTYFANDHGISETMTVSELLSYYKSKLEPYLKKYAKDALYLFASSKQPFEYTVDLLKSLKKKGYKIYYLSNWDKSSFTLCKEKGVFDFLDLFDGGIISYQVNATKPGEKIYKILLNKYNLNPENCLFYDDKQENIDTANKLKIHGKLFSYMKHTEKEIFNLPEVNISIKESVSEIDDKLTNLPKYYFASSTNMDGKTLKKRVPQNYLTKIGAEDNKTERICFSESISGCLTGLSQNIKDKDFYIHVPADNSYEFKTPTRTQVPDVDCTGEVWCISDTVKLKCIGKLHVIEDMGKPMFYKYKMPDGKIKTAATYSWNWKWIKDVVK